MSPCCDGQTPSVKEPLRSSSRVNLFTVSMRPRAKRFPTAPLQQPAALVLQQQNKPPMPKKIGVEVKKADTFPPKNCEEASGTLESSNNRCHQKSCRASVSEGSGCSRGKSNTGPRPRLPSGDVPPRGLFSLHTPGTKLAPSSRQSDINSPRGVYFCCVVCGSSKKKPQHSFI